MKHIKEMEDLHDTTKQILDVGLKEYDVIHSHHSDGDPYSARYIIVAHDIKEMIETWAVFDRGDWSSRENFIEEGHLDKEEPFDGFYDDYNSRESGDAIELSSHPPRIYHGTIQHPHIIKVDIFTGGPLKDEEPTIYDQSLEKYWDDHIEED